jgi:hypothetical protein
VAQPVSLFRELNTLRNAVRCPHHINDNGCRGTNSVIDCGNAISNGGAPAPGGISDCNMLCTGNSSEFCGAGNRLDVYQATGTGGGSGTTTTPATTTAPATTTTAASGPSHVAKVGAYTWAGCYTEATNGRALTGSSEVNYNTMTVEICAAFCASFTIFGIEYSKCLSLNSEKRIDIFPRRRMLLRQLTQCWKCPSQHRRL